MSERRGSEFSAAFDAMLEDSRRALDSLYQGSTPEPRPAPRAPRSEAERFLDDRYGDGWRCEVSERRREGDEVLVLCKLVIPAHDILRSQFGGARIGGGEAPLRGSSAGTAFTLGGDAPAAKGDGIEAAYRRAEADGLVKCVALL